MDWTALRHRVPSLADSMSAADPTATRWGKYVADRRWRRDAQLGFRTPRIFRPDPDPRPPDRSGALCPAPSRGAPGPAADPSGNLGVLSICTASHLAFARTLFDGVRRHHPEAALFLCVVDDEPGVAVDWPDVTIVRPSALCVPRFPFLALKYSATDLCCALKPFAIRHVLEHMGVDRLIYLDADVFVYE